MTDREKNIEELKQEIQKMEKEIAEKKLLSKPVMMPGTNVDVHISHPKNY